MGLGWGSREAILAKAVIYISPSTLSNNSLFIGLPLASVCSIYLSVPLASVCNACFFLETPYQPATSSEMWGQWVGSGSLCPVVQFPASCSAAVFTAETAVI